MSLPFCSSGTQHYMLDIDFHTNKSILIPRRMGVRVLRERLFLDPSYHVPFLHHTCHVGHLFILTHEFKSSPEANFCKLSALLLLQILFPSHLSYFSPLFTHSTHTTHTTHTAIHLPLSLHPPLLHETLFTSHGSLTGPGTVRTGFLS